MVRLDMAASRVIMVGHGGGIGALGVDALSGFLVEGDPRPEEDVELAFRVEAGSGKSICDLFSCVVIDHVGDGG